MVVQNLCSARQHNAMLARQALQEGIPSALLQCLERDANTMWGPAFEETRSRSGCTRGGSPHSKLGLSADSCPNVPLGLACYGAALANLCACHAPIVRHLAAEGAVSLLLSLAHQCCLCSGAFPGSWKSLPALPLGEACPLLDLDPLHQHLLRHLLNTLSWMCAQDRLVCRLFAERHGLCLLRWCLATERVEEGSIRSSDTTPEVQPEMHGSPSEEEVLNDLDLVLGCVDRDGDGYGALPCLYAFLWHVSNAPDLVGMTLEADLHDLVACRVRLSHPLAPRLLFMLEGCTIQRGETPVPAVTQDAEENVVEQGQAGWMWRRGGLSGKAWLLRYWRLHTSEATLTCHKSDVRATICVDLWLLLPHGVD